MLEFKCKDTADTALKYGGRQEATSDEWITSRAPHRLFESQFQSLLRGVKRSPATHLHANFLSDLNAVRTPAMKAQVVSAAVLAAACLSGLAASEPAWHDLAITAPRHGRYLYRTASEDAFFWQADTAWEMIHRLNKTSIDFYLRSRAEQGFNVVQTVIISELNGTTRPNFYGDLPFNNSDPTQPNEEYFALVDWASELAASYGILLALVPTWGMYVSGGYHDTESIFNESSAQQWGQYIGARYPGLPKILGGDTHTKWVRNIEDALAGASTSDEMLALMDPIEDTTDIWKSMYAGLVEAEREQGYESVIIYHPAVLWFMRPEETAIAYGHNMLPEEEYRVSIDAVQSGHSVFTPNSSLNVYEYFDSTKNYECIAGMRDGFSGPVVDLENHYEGCYVGFDPTKMMWNASHIRTGLYHGVYGGSAGFTYGANSVWQMYEPRSDLLQDSDYYAAQIAQNVSGSWRKDLEFEGATQIQYVTQPLQGLDTLTLEQLEPARGLLGSVSGSNDTAVNLYEGTQYISVLASLQRDRYYAYTGHGDSFSLDLGSISSARNGTARWFSPRDGQYCNETSVAIPAYGNGDTRVDFTPPSSGGVDNDWLLEVEF